MTLTNTTSKASFAGTGGTEYDLPGGFYFILDADLEVWREDADGNQTLLTITTDYTLTGAGDLAGGGTVTTVATYSDGKVIVIRKVQQTQTYDPQQGDDSPSNNTEKQLDRMVMMVQAMQNQLDLCFQITDSDDSGADTILPASDIDAKKNKILGTDDSGALAFVSVTADLSGYTISSANVANAIVQRDANGDFAAGDITAVEFIGQLTGNVVGDVTGELTGGASGLASGSLIDVQIFKVSGTWNKPSGCTRVEVWVVGPGGSGACSGNAIATVYAAAGGSSGAGSYKVITSGLGATEAVTVGVGGAAQTVAGAPGNDGSAASSFGAHCSAGPGQGGKYGTIGTNIALASGGVTPASATGGDVNIDGAPGHVGIYFLDAGVIRTSPGSGASSPFGLGTGGNWDGSAGKAGNGFGSGGGAAAEGTISTEVSGAGANGIVIVKSYK